MIKGSLSVGYVWYADRRIMAVRMLMYMKVACGFG